MSRHRPSVSSITASGLRDRASPHTVSGVMDVSHTHSPRCSGGARVLVIPAAALAGNTNSVLSDLEQQAAKASSPVTKQEAETLLTKLLAASQSFERPTARQLESEAAPDVSKDLLTPVSSVPEVRASSQTAPQDVCGSDSELLPGAVNYSDVPSM